MLFQVKDGQKLQKKYFEALQDAINLFPGFSPEIQGVYLEKEKNGELQAKCYVLKKEFDKALN